MRLAIVVLVLAGCDGIWDLDAVVMGDGGASSVDGADGPRGDAAPGCEVEEFGGTALVGSWPAFSDDPSMVIVAERNGRLEIELPFNYIGDLEGGVRSSSSMLSLDGRYVEVEASPPTAFGPGVESYLEVGLNAENRYTIVVKEGQLIFSSRVLGTYVEHAQVTYSREAHRVWRIADVPGSNQVMFAAGPGDSTWTRMLSITKTVRLDPVRIGLVAGTHGSGAPEDPGLATFDNLAICPNL